MKTPLFQYNPPGYERNMNKYSAYGRYGAQHSRPAAAGYFYDVRRKARKTCAAHNASGQYLLPYISQLPDQIPSFSLTSSMLRPLFVIAFSSSFSAFAFAAFLAFASAAFSAFFFTSFRSSSSCLSAFSAVFSASIFAFSFVCASRLLSIFAFSDSSLSLLAFSPP